MLKTNKGTIQAWLPTIVGIVIVLLIGGGIMAWQYLRVSSEEIKAPEEEVKVEEEVTKNETADWKTYRNEEYRFEFKYPEEKEQDNKFLIIEKENKASIYGWPDSTILLLGCDYCQSYEMVIQLWADKSDFENNCSGYCNPDLKFQIGDKYITLTNNNKTEIVNQILSTFQFLK